MTSIRFHSTGGPEVLRHEEVELKRAGQNELIVLIEAIGLNRAEAMFRQGQYLEEPEFPAGLGYEASAIVEEVGAGASQWKPGDRVNVIPSFSMNKYSVYAERAVVPATSLVRRANEQDAITAAGAWMAYLTSYGALVDICDISPDDVVFINAASSSVGLAAIDIVNSLGATTIAGTRTHEKVEALRQHGATHVIATQEQDFVSELLRLSDGKGVSYIFDPVAGSGIEALAAAAAPGATIILYGLLSGEPTPFPLRPSFLKGLSIRGYTLFEITNDPSRFERGKEYVLQGLDEGRFNPTIDRTFEFDQMVEAHRYLEGNQQIGKIVVTVN